jgi:hypothetical protein
MGIDRTTEAEAQSPSAIPPKPTDATARPQEHPAQSTGFWKRPVVPLSREFERATSERNRQEQ